MIVISSCQELQDANSGHEQLLTQIGSTKAKHFDAAHNFRHNRSQRLLHSLQWNRHSFQVWGGGTLWLYNDIFQTEQSGATQTQIKSLLPWRQTMPTRLMFFSNRRNSSSFYIILHLLPTPDFKSLHIMDSMPKVRSQWTVSEHIDLNVEGVNICEFCVNQPFPQTLSRHSQFK